MLRPKLRQKLSRMSAPMATLQAWPDAEQRLARAESRNVLGTVLRAACRVALPRPSHAARYTTAASALALQPGFQQAAMVAWV